MSGELAQRARSHLEAGEYRKSREAALEGLAAEPADAELLTLAGRAGLELDAEDAVGQLRRATELAGDDAEAWHYLGEALAAEGRTEEAHDAFRRAVELDPDDQVALSHLGHTSHATGRDQDAVKFLAQAADRTRGASTAAVSLVDLYRTMGQYEDALVQASRIAEAAPEDVIAALDVAELSTAVGRLDQAVAAFARLRELDEEPGHEAYPLYGMVQAEIKRENWARALELARELPMVDAPGVNRELIAYLEMQIGPAETAAIDGPAETAAIDGPAETAAIDGPAETAAPARDEVEAALARALGEYRRLHADDRGLAAEDHLG